MECSNLSRDLRAAIGRSNRPSCVAQGRLGVARVTPVRHPGPIYDLFAWRACLRVATRTATPLRSPLGVELVAGWPAGWRSRGALRTRSCWRGRGMGHAQPSATYFHDRRSPGSAPREDGILPELARSRFIAQPKTVQSSLTRDVLQIRMQASSATIWIYADKEFGGERFAPRFERNPGPRCF